jgi:predicted outer membrane protein
MRCVVGMPAVPKGRDIEMATLCGKSPLYRASILLWLSAGLALLLLGAVPMATQTGSTQSPSGSIVRAGASAEIVAQQQAEIGSKQEQSQGSITARQKQYLLKENLERLRRDAGELADLSKALQKELNTSSENVLSLDIAAKADKIQKLAKKIKSNSRGI